MKIINPTLTILISLLLLGAIGYAGLAAFDYLGTLYQGLEPQVARITTIASVVAVFCALIVAGSLKSGGQCVSAERIALYQQLLGHWAERLNVQNVEERIAGNELAGLEQSLALQGSQKVVAAYMNLRNSATQDGKADDELRELMKKLVMEMRADIGRAEFNLNKNDLLDLLLGKK